MWKCLEAIGSLSQRGGGGVSGDGGGAGGRVQLFHQSKKGLLKGFQNKSTSFKAVSVMRFDLPIPIIPSFP